MQPRAILQSCSGCGRPVDASRIFCSACGKAVPGVRPAIRRAAAPVRWNPPALPFGLAGLVAGGAIGYWMRPFVSLRGQLAFETVFTRGASLHGVDRLLVPAAQASFDRMLLFAIVGMIAGLLANLLLRRVR